MLSVILSVFLAILGCFLMFVILLQRGRGGGLAGAFGGLGGQSAFGTKAGDVFTKITIVIAVLWVALSGFTGVAMWKGSEGKYQGAENGEPKVTAPKGDDETPSPFDGSESGADPKSGGGSEEEEEGSDP